MASIDTIISTIGTALTLVADQIKKQEQLKKQADTVVRNLPPPPPLPKEQ
mgnify:CR=1 FL=1|jgi:cytochrome P450